MHLWRWFETKMLGYTPRKLPLPTRLKLIVVAALLGIVLGFALTLTGVGTSFIAAGMREAGFDTSPLVAATHPPSRAVTVGTPPPLVLTATPRPRRGGWINP